jgi:hypothetical protein
MKALNQIGLVVALGILLCPGPGHGASGSQMVTLGWKPSPDSAVAGYYFYYGTTPGSYTGKVDVGTNTVFTLTALAAGATYHFSVTAYNTARIESVPISGLAYQVPGFLTLSPNPTGGGMVVRFPAGQGQTYQLQRSLDLRSWSNLWLSPGGSTSGWVEFADPQTNLPPAAFYRWLRL